VALAGLAALRAGCDLVTIMAPEKVAWAINAQSADLITVKLPGTKVERRHIPAIAKQLAKADAFLVGNGMGRDPSTAQACKLLACLTTPKVIDADGVKAVAARDCVNAILTPNGPELRIFLKNSKCSAQSPAGIRKALAPFFAAGNVLLIKGPTDTIISAKGIVRVEGGNPGLTKGGTGDVLAGLALSYLALQKDPILAAKNASVMAKRIGDALKKKHKGYTYLASDMVEEIRRLC
jgi:NAD(P)H-hydrate epimerase